MKVGIIRCMQTEDFCPGTTDFRMIREKKGAFEGVEEDIEIIGFINCGGCPGKKAVLRARELVNRWAVYTIRYFQFDGEGTLKLDNGLVFLPNDRYLLENEKFRLYYTSECDESQSLTITVEDNFGNAFEWEVEFNNDSDTDVAVSDTLNVSR